MKLVFATNNAHKLEEIKEMLGSQHEIVSLKEIQCHENIPEEQDTLEGNALQKARYIHEKNEISHRGQAVRALCSFLNNL